MRLSKQKSVETVRSYNGKTFFGLTVITAVILVIVQIFFFPPREFVGAYLHWKFEVCRCRGCRGIAGERHTHTHTQTLTCDIDPVPISIYFKFWIWNIKRKQKFQSLGINYVKIRKLLVIFWKFRLFNIGFSLNFIQK